MRQVMPLSIVLTVGLVSGCSGPGSAGKPEPPDAPGTTAATRASTPPTPPVTGPASPTPGSALASVPVAARQHSEAGAEAFVRFYIDQLNLAWTVPDPTRLAALGDPECLSCASLEHTARELAAMKRRYAAAPVSITTVAAFGGAPAGQQLVRLAMEQHAVSVIDGGGHVVTRDEAKPVSRDVLLKWRAGAWRVFGIAG